MKITDEKENVMEILGRVNVYLDLLRNENARLSNEIFNLVRLNERILRDVEPLFLRDNDLQNSEYETS